MCTIMTEQSIHLSFKLPDSTKKKYSGLLKI